MWKKNKLCTGPTMPIKWFITLTTLVQISGIFHVKTNGASTIGLWSVYAKTLDSTETMNRKLTRDRHPNNAPYACLFHKDV